MECALGNLIADSMYESEYGNDLDIAVINDGGIRAGMARGNVTTADILTVLPFPNLISIFFISGEELLASLEYISAGITDTGLRIVSLCHWAGLNYSYSANAPFMKKVSSVFIENYKTKRIETLQLNKTYKIAGNDFLTSGGDNIFTKRPSVNGRLLSEILQDYIEDAITITPKVGSRIRRLE